MLNDRTAFYPECSSIKEDTKIIEDFLNNPFMEEMSSPEELEKTLDKFIPILEATDRLQTYCTLKKVINDDADDENLIKLIDKVNYNFNQFESRLLEINDLEDWMDKPNLMKYTQYFDRLSLRKNASGYSPTVARYLGVKRDIINDLKTAEDSVSDLASLYFSSISVDESIAKEMGFSSSYEAVSYRDRFSDYCIDTSLLNYPLTFMNIDLERLLSKKEIDIPIEEALNLIKSVLSHTPLLLEYFSKVVDSDYIKIDNTQELGYKSKNFSIDTYTFRPLTFVNYDGSFSSIGDLAHEIGHGIFTLCQKDYNNILSFSKSPLEAETAAILFEMKIYYYLEEYILDYYLDRENSGGILDSLAASRLKFIRDNFYYNLALIDFERKCHIEYDNARYINEKKMQSYCLNSFYKYLNRRDISLKDVLSNIEIYKPYYALNYVLGFLFAYSMMLFGSNQDITKFFKKGFSGVPVIKLDVYNRLDSIIEELEKNMTNNFDKFLVKF